MVDVHGPGNKMEEFLRVEDYDGLATFCEHAELEASRVVRSTVQ